PALLSMFLVTTLVYSTGFIGITLLVSSKCLIYAVVTGILGTIAFLSIIPLGKRSRRYRLKLEEQLLIPAYHVIADLGAYLKEDDPLPHYRKQAETDLVELTERIEETWTVGSYKLATLTMSPVPTIKKSLR